MKQKPCFLFLLETRGVMNGLSLAVYHFANSSELIYNRFLKRLNIYYYRQKEKSISLMKRSTIGDVEPLSQDFIITPAELVQCVAMNVPQSYSSLCLLVQYQIPPYILFH